MLANELRRRIWDAVRSEVFSPTVESDQRFGASHVWRAKRDDIEKLEERKVEPEAQAENLEAMADNTTNDAAADALEAQADNVEDAGQAKEEAIDDADVNATNAQ